MITDRSEQLERPATTRPHPFRQRYVLSRRHLAAAAATVRPAAQDPRAGVATPFRTLAHGVAPAPAQARATTFYRSTGQVWARSLGMDEAQASRGSVAAAFRAMARGVRPDRAREATLRFYRSSGHAWTRGLSGGDPAPSEYANT
jgi:hypothetical protein